MTIQDTVAPSEIIRITTSGGSGATSLTVTRGADGTTPVAHASGATFVNTCVASALNAMGTGGSSTGGGGGGGPASVYYSSSATGTVALLDPTSTGYTTQRLGVPNSGTVTLVNPAATVGSSFEVQIETGTGTTVVFPSTNTRWAGTMSGAGAAPTVLPSSVTKFAVECIDGTHFDWSFIGRLA